MTHSVADGLKIAVIGGGFTGSVFALKALRALPNATVTLIEQRSRPGRGLAYGDAAPYHLLNVPVSRAEMGLEPRFLNWLEAHASELSEALEESGGDLGSSFVARDLYGVYLEQLVRSATSSPRLQLVVGQAVRLETATPRAVILEDGRSVSADVVVLVTGNLTAQPLLLPGYHSDACVVNNPWAPHALDAIGPSDPILLIGAGLTMIDIVLKLVESGHHGPIIGLSRHGILPATHAAGGQMSPFIAPGHRTPVQVFREIRRALSNAQQQAVPWQRVLDAVRPVAGRLWHNWSLRERRQFMRHLQAIWTSTRHRMAPRVSRRIRGLQQDGQLRIMAGRVRCAEAIEGKVVVEVAKRGGGSESVRAASIVNCTGPRGDIAAVESALFASLRQGQAILPDALGLGIETDDSAVIGAYGDVSNWLFALGPLTRPAWWEITAIPEINSQIERLVQKLAARSQERPSAWTLLADEFVDLGAGI